MKNILFVCTGNTCRSAMAKAISDKICFENNLSYCFDSCGLAAQDGSAASDGAIAALSELYGIDLTYHRSKQISRELLDNADVVFAMSQNHALPIMALDEYRDKVRVANSPISDPYMQSTEVYKACAIELYAQIEALLKEMA